MPLTSAIKEYVQSKVTTLEKVIHTPAYVHVEIGKPSSHHKSGEDVFQAELTIDTNGQTYFSRVMHADLYQALDQVVLKIAEMIKQNKGKKQTLFRKGRMVIKKLLKKGTLK